MILLVDNFDSFTYNLVDYLYRAGASCDVIRNNVSPSQVDISRYKGLMLSPGPETPQKSGFLLEYIRHFHDQLPVLGICLGHQALGQYFGAELIKGLKPMHGKVSSIKISGDEIFMGLGDSVEIVRYNSLILNKVNGDLKTIAESVEGEVMAIRHKYLPVWGLQFHPEAALTQGGLKMIKNWLSYNNIA